MEGGTEEFEPMLPVEVILSENAWEESTTDLQGNYGKEICAVDSSLFQANKELVNPSGDKHFLCNICGKSYQTKDYLIIHTRIHTGEKPYFCDLCGKSFSDPSSFKQHEKQHSDTDTKIPCEICGKIFKREKNLKLHMLVHSENGFENASGINGTGGKMMFSNKFKLDALKKVKEIGQRETSKLMKIPYTTLRNWVNVCKKEHNCQFCGRSFPFKATLERHEKLKHGDGGSSQKATFNRIKFDSNFKTEVAEFALQNTTEEAMKKYDLADSTIRRWIKVTKSPIICSLCGRTCAYKKELQRHMVEVHNADEIAETCVEKPLSDFLTNSGENLNFEKKSETIDGNTTSLHDPKHGYFLNQIIKKYSGNQLSKILEKIKTLTGHELEALKESQKDCNIEKLLLDKKAEHNNHNYLDIENNEEKEKEFSFVSNNNSHKEPIISSIKKEDNLQDCVKDELIDSNSGDESNLGNEWSYLEYEEEAKYQDEDSIIDLKEELDEPIVKVEDFDNEMEDVYSSTSRIISVTNEPNLKPAHKRFLPCETCGKTFKSPCDLERHQVKHTGEKAFSCNLCGALFAHQSGVNRHMKIHANERSYVCRFCNKGFNQKTSLVVHERGHTGEKPYKCDECEDMFSSKAKLMNHKYQNHNTPKPFNCDECGKGFMRSTEIDAHKRTHTGEKPFTCERCGDCFTFIGGLKKHKRRHDIQDGVINIEDKRLDCTQCGKAFYTKANLQRHLKAHLGIKDFQCVDCGKQYSSERSLQQHVAIVHHGQRGFECQECGKSFTRVTSLRVHKLTHTNETPYKCEFCSQGYKEKRNLLKHIERQHITQNPYNTDHIYTNEDSFEDGNSTN